ncbi:MAG: protein kinase, partial [Myxococcota bacterium]
MTEQLPERIGAFQVEGVVGRGGMGIVLRAASPDGDPVAIKLLHEDLATGDPGILRRFEREAAIRLEHPNVVRVVDAGRSEAGRRYIVFELLEGEPLDVRLAREKTLSPRALHDLLLQIAKGLEAAHAEGIVHRDLKPGNVFWCRDGTVKVLDFGVARLKQRSNLTMTGTILGTPAYLSPEQIKGRDDVDGRADLWSVGVIGYEALTGRLPFQQDATYAMLMSILLEEATPLDRVAPGAPPELASIVERCLQKDPYARFADARALRAALEQVPIEHLGALSRPPPSVGKSAELPIDEQRVVAVVLAREVLERRRAAAAIERQGGVAVPMRENVVGIFGNQAWHGDEVVKAVNAALACRPFSARVGVGVGRAVGAGMGAGVSGEAVEAADRASELPLEGVGVLQSAAPAIRASHKTRPIPGRADLVEVVAEEEQRTSHLPFVGRDREVEQLRAAWAKATEGPRLLVLRGPLGMGKTRLRRAFEQELREEGVAVLGARADPAHRARVLWLLGEVIRRDVAARFPERPLADALEARVREVLPFDDLGVDGGGVLAEHLGLGGTETLSLEASSADPQLMGDMVRLTVEDYLSALMERGPTLLVLEDAQFCDEETLELVDGLIDRVSTASLLVIVVERSGGAQGLASRFAHWDDVETLDVGGLPAEPARAFARSIGGRSLADEVLGTIVQRAEGNPLFVEHMVMALRHDAGASGAEEAPLPITVEAAVQSRLQQLAEVERELLKRASLFVPTFGLAELEAVGVTDPGPGIATLLDRGVFEEREVGTSSVRTFAFRTDLVREVAGRMLTPELRRSLHGSAADVLARGPHVDPERVARHLEEAARQREASRWYARATLESSSRGDFGSTLRCSARALELGVPDDALFRVCFLRADALRFRGSADQRSEALQQAMAAARSDADVVRVMVEEAAHHLRTGRVHEGLARAGAAVRAVRKLEAPVLRAQAHARHGEALLRADRGKQAEAAFDRAEAALEGAPSPHVQALVAGYRAHLFSSQGRLGEALIERRRAIALFESAGDLRRAAPNQVNLANLLNQYGRYAEAEAALRRASEICRRVDNRSAEGYARVNLGYSLLQLVRIDEALGELEAASAAAERLDDANLAAYATLYRARAHVVAGDAANARAVAEGLLQDGATAATATLARAIAARAALAEGDVEQAFAYAS